MCSSVSVNAVLVSFKSAQAVVSQRPTAVPTFVDKDSLPGHTVYGGASTKCSSSQLAIASVIGLTARRRRVWNLNFYGTNRLHWHRICALHW